MDLPNKLTVSKLSTLLSDELEVQDISGIGISQIKMEWWL